MTASTDGVLRVATCQFPETFAPTRNARIMREQIAVAVGEGADLVHFHECALSGYGGPIGVGDYDWDALRAATESLIAAAAAHGVWLAVGSSHPLTPPHRPHNCVYLISPDGRIVNRYDKRFCTRGDLNNYTPGDHFVTFTINGVKCGLLICYDFRFPELYRTLYTKGVRVMLHSFHNAGGSGPGVLTHVARATLQGYAGVNGMWISAANSSRFYSMWPGSFITPDGRIAGKLRRNRRGVMVNTIDLAHTYYDASSPFRDRCIRGTFHSGRTVKDARSDDRTRL